MALPRHARAGCCRGVEVRIVGDDGDALPWDGEAVGELEVRGPWITGAYYQDPTTPTKFHDGWLRTGDVGTLDAERLHHAHRPRQGRHQVRRRVDLLGRAGERADGPPRRASRPRSIGVPDERWSERPLACVVLPRGLGRDRRRSCASSSRDTVAKWQLPERWTFIDEVPKTSVGKFDKKVLRRQYAEGQLDVKVAHD